MEELGAVVTDSGHRLDLYLRSNKILVLGANASVPVLEIDADSFRLSYPIGIGAELQY